MIKTSNTRGYILFMALMLLALPVARSQTYEYVYRDTTDSTYNCYLKAIPDGPARGLIVRDYSSLPDTAKASPYRLQQLAVENGFLMLYTVTSPYFPEMYYHDSAPALLDEMIHEVLTAHRIPVENIFTGGISSSGTRALRHAQYCAEVKSAHNIAVKGVFAADPPLDLERFYRSAHDHRDNFKKGMLWEADLIVKAFPQKLGGTSDEQPGAYRKASVYSYTDPRGGNARYYREIPIIIFHEPDIEWWIRERGATYYDINSFDIAGFVHRLLALGNERVELVTTTGKGFDREGRRNCHSWSIVDEEYLMSWMLGQMNIRTK